MSGRRHRSSSWAMLRLWESPTHTVVGFLKGRRHRSTSLGICCWLNWWAVQFTFSQGARTAIAFRSPVPARFAAHKLLVLRFSATCLLASFSPITPPPTHLLPTVLSCVLGHSAVSVLLGLSALCTHQGQHGGLLD